MNISKIILEQLGGNKFIAMTGAKNFVGGKKSLSFKIGDNCKKVTHVRITLSDKDLYDMEFLKIRGIKVSVLNKSEDLCFDSLQKVFTLHTGMYTHL